MLVVVATGVLSPLIMAGGVCMVWMVVLMVTGILLPLIMAGGVCMVWMMVVVAMGILLPLIMAGGVDVGGGGDRCSVAFDHGRWCMYGVDGGGGGDGCCSCIIVIGRQLSEASQECYWHISDQLTFTDVPYVVCLVVMVFITACAVDTIGSLQVFHV